MHLLFIDHNRDINSAWEYTNSKGIVQKILITFKGLRFKASVNNSTLFRGTISLSDPNSSEHDTFQVLTPSFQFAGKVQYMPLRFASNTCISSLDFMYNSVHTKKLHEKLIQFPLICMQNCINFEFFKRAWLSKNNKSQRKTMDYIISLPTEEQESKLSNHINPQPVTKQEIAKKWLMLMYKQCRTVEAGLMRD